MRSRKYAADRQLIDLIAELPGEADGRAADGPAASAAGPALFGRVQPQGASRRSASPVGLVRWESHGRKRDGVASTYFADRRKAGESVRRFTSSRTGISACPRTRDRPIIMIGAGTGVAPYRAFVQERAEAWRQGQELAVLRRAQLHQRLPLPARVAGSRSAGALSRIDVAFSRDQPEKVYVQHRLWERRAELRLDRGWRACLRLRRREGHGEGRRSDACPHRRRARAAATAEAAEAYLGDLRRGRYQRDVY